MPPKSSGGVRSGILNVELPSGPQAAELFDKIVDTPGVRVERIVSTGQATPEDEWYDQSRDEFVLLFCGAARLRIEGETDDRELGPGDWLLLPAHCRHRVTWTQAAPPTIWMAVHYCATPEDAGSKE